MKKIGVLLCVLLISLAVIGCSNFRSDDDSSTVTIGGIEGPRTVYTVEDWIDTMKVDADGDSYRWFDYDGSLIELENKEAQETKIRGLEAGNTSIRVEVDGTIYGVPFPIQIIGEKNENLYAGSNSQFHAISFLDDADKFLAAGWDYQIDRKPYAVMAEKTGAISWEGTFEGAGRLYGVQDIVAEYGVLRSNHEYYLIGYSQATAESYQAYLARVSEDRHRDGTPVITQEFIDETLDKDTFLRSGIGVKGDSGSSRNENLIVVVGNYVVADYEAAMNVAPYLGVVDISEDGDGDEFERIKLEEDDKLNELGWEYYNLFEITTIADNNDPRDGYLVAGFAAKTGSGMADSDGGIVMKLNYEFEVESVNWIENEDLYSIKRIGSDEFIVAGANGYIAIVNENGSINESNNISGVGTFRGIETDGDNYYLVSQNAKVVKVDSDLNLTGFKIKDYGESLFDIAKSDNNNFFLAGRDNTGHAYVVKIDSGGEIVGNDLSSILD